jgi:AcrR family transcriptional regulator
MSRDRVILDAAVRLFYERGFDGVGVDELGVAAGVTGPAIYRHFRNKDEILATLFDEAMDRLLQLAGPPREDPWEELRALVRAQAGFALRDRELLSVYSREDRSLAETSRRRLHRRQRQYVERWVEVLRRCYPERADNELTSAAYATIGLLLSIAHWPREARTTARLESLLESLVVGGLSALEDRPHDADGQVPAVSTSAAGRASARRRS